MEKGREGVRMRGWAKAEQKAERIGGRIERWMEGFKVGLDKGRVCGR